MVKREITLGLYSQAHPLEDEDLRSTTFLHAGDKRPNIKTIQVHICRQSAKPIK